MKRNERNETNDRGNLREGREVPLRGCLHPLRFSFRFRLNLFIIRKLAHHPGLTHQSAPKLRRQQRFFSSQADKKIFQSKFGLSTSE